MNQPHKHKKFSWENWIRRFYGVQNLDEYRMAEINKIGNKAYLILLPYLSLANVAAYFLWYFQPEWAFLKNMSYIVDISSRKVYTMCNIYVTHKKEGVL